MYIDTESKIVYGGDGSISITAIMTVTLQEYVEFTKKKTEEEKEKFAKKRSKDMEQALRNEMLASVDMQGECNRLKEYAERLKAEAKCNLEEVKRLKAIYKGM